METENVGSQRLVDPGENSRDQVVDGSLDKNNQEKIDVSPVLKWLQKLDLEKYAEVFIHEEIDWDTLQSLTEEDLFTIGVTALGPRKKILNALNELRRGTFHSGEMHTNGTPSSGSGKQREILNIQISDKGSIDSSDDTNKLNANKLITDYFPAPNIHKNLNAASNGSHPAQQKNPSELSAHNAKPSVSKTKCDAVSFKNETLIVNLWIRFGEH
uniref:SAM domain-containing protein n=1 Tax=Kalanchoe fedtschenkoi TaxID=63787 RepID=A0A7N1A8V3_KALFE